MKYKKGSMVEVLTTDEVPYHSWRCAQIVSSNGHNYTVRYDVYPGFTNQGKVEHVSKKFIRPCPPSVEILECRPGDVVEVFHNLSWKMAIVSKAFGWDCFLVRLVGSFSEFEASKAEIRVRQSWQNDEWVVIGKDHTINAHAQYGKLSKCNIESGSQEKRRKVNRDSYLKSLQFGTTNDNLPESHIVSARTLKRGSPYYLSQDEVNEGTSLKFRISLRESKRLRVLVKSPKEVDAVPNSRELVSERGVYRKTNDDDSVVCSVGSCSVNSYSCYDSEDIESRDSDAESVCQTGYQEDLKLSKKEFAAEVHRLELQAYRCTLEALHASGPLTWEKETMAQSWRVCHLLLAWYVGA
ncbi:Agenet-like domain-containing protein [Artemisia annua]|uniref:Agenet-like domain-containing protein n=1 Tax=Artemisia annua TaxID=35608 RepID=A0A2U1QGH8_ARTAN|nr:Agenet-like domain-containing protein [Artemisia annua]